MVAGGVTSRLTGAGPVPPRGATSHDGAAPTDEPPLKWTPWPRTPQTPPSGPPPRERSRRRDGPRAGVEVGHQPSPRAGRPRLRARLAAPPAAFPGHPADGGRPAGDGRGDRGGCGPGRIGRGLAGASDGPRRPGHDRCRQRRHSDALPATGRRARRRPDPLRRRPEVVRTPPERCDRRPARPRRADRRRRPRRAAAHGARRGRPGRRPGRDRRVLVVPVRVGAPAVRPALQPGRRGPPRRLRPAVDAAHPDDRGHAARGGRPGGHPGVGRRAERLAGHAGCAAGPGPHRRARPLQRPAVPGGGAGDRRKGRRPGLAAPHHPAR